MKFQKTIACGAALTLLSACAVDPESYKTVTKNGEDYYALDIQGIGGPNQTQLKHWGEQFCPHGYRVHEVKVDYLTPVLLAPGMNWWDVTIACPAR